MIKKILLAVLSVFLLCVVVKPCSAADFYVPLVYSTIQSAIDDPECGTGDSVIVFPETYDGQEGFYDISFHGKKITVKSLTGPVNCIIICPAGHRAFNFRDGEDADSVVEGITIKDAQGSYNGGAIFCEESSPTIKNCIIQNCSASNGGGVYCQGSSPLIIDCNISGNTAEFDGGGIYCDANSSPVISGCTIGGNFAEQGAGLFCGPNSTPTITDTTLIIGNQARWAGGGIYCEYSNPVITNNCTITGNAAIELAESYGGGIYCRSACPTITNCSITENHTESEYDSLGGGIYLCQSSAPVITATTISGNWTISEYSSTYGGGIYIGDLSKPVINGCTIRDNIADSNDEYESGFGGAIYCEAASFTLTDSTIYGNSANFGGAVNCYQANSIEIANSTISNNTASDSGGGIYMEMNCSGKIVNCAIAGNSAVGWGGGLEFIQNSNVTVKNCVISGNRVETWTGGAIDCLGSSPFIVNCTISSNESVSDIGGGINCEDDYEFSNPVISSCIFENNSKYAIIETGPGSDPNLRYCLFYNNTPDMYGDYGDYWDNDTSLSYTGEANSPDSINNIPDGLTVGNIGADPMYAMDGAEAVTGTWAPSPNEPYYNADTKRTLLTDISAAFVDTELVGKHINPNTAQRQQVLIIANTAQTIEVVGNVTSYVSTGNTYQILDYHITIGSPAGHAGDPDYTPEPTDVDIDGDRRLVGSRVEAGVDELAVDYADIVDLISHWLESGCSDSGWCSGADIDKSGTVDFEDLTCLAVHWIGTVEP